MLFDFIATRRPILRGEINRIRKGSAEYVVFEAILHDISELRGLETSIILRNYRTTNFGARKLLYELPIYELRGSSII